MMKTQNKMNQPIFNSKPNTFHHSKEDGRGRWHSRACAVVAHVIFAYDNGELFYLIGKRGNVTDQPNKYNVPCGYFDWNEDLKGAMFREVWEETGLDLNQYSNKILVSDIEQPWYVNTNPNQNRENISFHTGIVILLEKGEELPKLSLDNMEENEATFVGLMSIDSVKFIPETDWAFNHDKYINDFLKYLKNKNT